MAGTRNKQTQLDYVASQIEQQKLANWYTPTILQSPAYPCSGINVQRMPASMLTLNSIDVENYLYGIGANNYIFPVQQPTPEFIQLPNVSFTIAPNLYIPRLPPFLQNQRPF